MQLPYVCIVSRWLSSTTRVGTPLTEWHKLTFLVSTCRRTQINQLINLFTNILSVQMERGSFQWDSKQQGVILAAFFYGYTTTQILGGTLAQRVGGKLLMLFGVFWTALLTLLTPVLTVYGGFPALVAVRVLEGIGEVWWSVLFLWTMSFCSISGCIALRMLSISFNLSELNAWIAILLLLSKIVCVIHVANNYISRLHYKVKTVLMATAK